MTGEACRPKCRDKAEQSLLLQIASTQRNRIRQHAQWLVDHPEAAALLRDTKNKGKGKERESNQDDIVYKEKAHFERCLEEVEPRQRLKELVASTRDWIECFKERLEVVQEAQHILESVRVIRESPPKEEALTTNPKRILENGTYDRPDERPKRRKTIDRGTSPIQEVVEKSLYLEHSHDYSEKVPDQAREPAQHAMRTGQALSTENTSHEDDSPPSPQSLPSPPPNAQVRAKHSAQATTEESQQSTADSSAKPASIPSVPSLPPIRSSSPVGGEDSFKITIRQTNVASDLPDLGAATSIATSKVEVVRKPKKRASKLPPITPEIHNLLEEASREAARKRKEEKQRLGEFDYDPWSELVGWVPPESLSAGAEEQSSEKLSPAIVTETTPIDTSVEEFTTARTHIVRTFDALDADSSENASQGRREREENEAMIAAFLREEEL